MSAKTERFPLKIGTKREEKEGKSWKILQFSDVWPAKFSTKFDGDVLHTFRPRAHLSRYVTNMILESTAVLNLARRPAHTVHLLKNRGSFIDEFYPLKRGSVYIAFESSSNKSGLFIES